MIAVCGVGPKSHESLVLPLAAAQTIVRDLYCWNPMNLKEINLLLNENIRKT